MKKLFLFSVAALAFCACSSDEVVSENNAANQQPKEISFTPLNKVNTRAASMNGAIESITFPTGLDMKVTAWEQGATGRDFFGATNFKHNYAGGNTGASHGWWGGDPARYWPLSPCYVNFLAITNANDDNTTGVTWGNSGTDAYASKVVVTMTDNYAYNTKQHDFMYAIGNGQVTQSGNALTFPDKVDMTFYHAQAYLVFQVKAADNASKAIKIKNIEISGARFAGTATITQTNYNATSAQATTLYWSPTTQINEYKSILNDQTAKADEAASVALTESFVQMGKIIVVPNMTAANTYTDNGTTKIKITYYLEGKEYTYEYEIDNDTYWAGKKYVYNITFKLHEIFINPNVEDWIVDLNNNSTADDDIMIDIPAQTTKHQTALTITANDAGRYTVKVTNLGASEGYTVVTTDDNNLIKEEPQPGSADANGVATLTFSVVPKTMDRTATITLTKSSDSSTTVITVKQE